MHRWRIGVAAAVVSAATVVVGAAPAVAAPVSYSPRVTGINGVAPAINDFNVVAGTSGTGAFTWSAGRGLRWLGMPSGATAAEAHGINELGEVAGGVEIDGAWRAAWWTSAGEPRLLSAAGHELTVATDINNRGQIVADGSASVRFDGWGASFVVLANPQQYAESGPARPQAVDDTGRVLGTYFYGGNGGRSIVWAPDGSVVEEDIGYGGLWDLADDGATAGYLQDETDVPHAVVIRGGVTSFPAGFPASAEENVPGSYARGLRSGPPAWSWWASGTPARPGGSRSSGTAPPCRTSAPPPRRHRRRRLRQRGRQARGGRGRRDVEAVGAAAVRPVDHRLGRDGHRRHARLAHRGRPPGAPGALDERQPHGRLVRHRAWCRQRGARPVGHPHRPHRPLLHADAAGLELHHVEVAPVRQPHGSHHRDDGDEGPAEPGPRLRERVLGRRRRPPPGAVRDLGPLHPLDRPAGADGRLTLLAPVPSRCGIPRLCGRRPYRGGR